MITCMGMVFLVTTLAVEHWVMQWPCPPAWMRGS